MAPKQAASAPNAPKRQKRPIFALWRPRRGNTRARDTQTRSEPDKRLPRHPARLVAPQNRGDARAGVGRRERCAGGPLRRRHKKTPPEGIRTASFTSSNCPRGETVCLDKAARRVGAGREDGKRKKAPCHEDRRLRVTRCRNRGHQYEWLWACQLWEKVPPPVFRV